MQEVRAEWRSALESRHVAFLELERAGGQTKMEG
jgi:hypothetical protein